MTLDPVRLPRASEYLASLPEGLASFPACQARNILLEPQVRDYSHLAAEPSLPEPVRDLLSGRLSDSAWISEVVFQTAYLAVRDLAFSDDATFNRWIFKINAEMFDKPLLRNLMRLVSPGLVVLGAQKRWHAFHQGSDLLPGAVQTADGRTTNTTRLVYPDGLFHPAFIAGLENTFLAAVMAARAREPRVALAAHTPGCATFEASWRA